MNFKGECVELTETQLPTLWEILQQDFNVEMTNEIHHLTTKQKVQSRQQLVTEMHYPTPSEQEGLFSKIKGFLKVNTKAQEIPA